MDPNTISHRARILRLGAAFLALLPLGLTVSGGGTATAASGDCTTAGGTVTCTYTSTGAAQTFTVPSWVTTVNVVARGAAGAVGSDGKAAGLGGEVTADLAVTGGDELTLVVGGEPTGSFNISCFVSTACIGGFNGGGTSRFGGGGGGASDVRVGGTDLDDRVLVAAGGGGSGFGWDCVVEASGGEGGNAGLPGQQGTLCFATAGTGGQAGIPDGTGAGGFPSGVSGTLGVGGNGGINNGGGGGGGWNGGGGGGGLGLAFTPDGTELTPAGGGGGGSNLVPLGGSAALGSGAPQIVVSYAGQADVALTKNAPTTAVTGSNIAYDLVITNNGPTDADAVSIVDNLPSPATFVSIVQLTGPAATITTPAFGGTGTVDIQLGTITNGATATFTLTVNVPAPFTGTLANTATASSATNDPNPITNTATAATRIDPLADLAVDKTGPTGAAAGSNISYTIDAVNNGPNDATDVSLSDTLPAGVTFVSFAQDTGPAATLVTPAVGSPGTVTATWATLANGASATFTLTVNVDQEFSGNVDNSATITADNPADPDQANDSSTASLTVTTTTTTTTTSTSTSTTTTTTLAPTTTTSPQNGLLPPTGNSTTLPITAVLAFGAGLALVGIASRRQTPN